MSNVGEKLYSGLATVGRYESTGLYIAMSIFSILAIGVGIYYFVKNPKYNKVVARIWAVPACRLANRGNTCDLEVEYKVGKKYFKTLVRQNYPFSINKNSLVGKNIDLYYDPKKPSTTTLSPVSRNIGIGLIILGVVIFVIGYYGNKTIQKDGDYAAYRGLQNIARL